MSCEGCDSAARVQNKIFEDLKTKAKIQAIEENKPQAICYDEATGLFITDAYTAFTEKYQIRDIISYL